MDYHSPKYSFGELSEHINRLESKFQLNNLYGKDSLQDTGRICDQTLFSQNQKGFRNGFCLSDEQNVLPTEKSSFEKVNSTSRCEIPKSEDISEKYKSDKMKPEEEINYIVKLEKMSADELMYSKKLNTDNKDRKSSGKFIYM